MGSLVERINIVCTLDNNYCQHCAVLLSSIFETNKELFFDTYILSDFIDETNRNKLSKLVDNYSQKLHYIQIDKKQFEGLPFGGRFSNISLATYYRLMLPDVLPESLDKVLYLDCDIVVNGGISSLWNLDLQKNAVAGVEDSVGISSNAPKRLGYPAIYSYFNAGVMLMSLSTLREMQFTPKALSYIKWHLKEIVYHDQDILNALLYDKKIFLPIKWNVMECFLFRHPLIHPKYKWELGDAQKNPVIIHFTGILKPWYKECTHPYKELYYYYLNKTGLFSDTPFLLYVRKIDRIIFYGKKVFKWILDNMKLGSYLYNANLRK